MEWIRVKDRLPKIGEPVLLGNRSWPRSCIGEWKGGDDWTGYLDQQEELPEGDPTHWQPLPKPPEDVHD